MASVRRRGEGGGEKKFAGSVPVPVGPESIRLLDGMVTLSQFCRRHADAAAQLRSHHYPGAFLEAEGSGVTACNVDVTSVTWLQDNVRDYG